MGITHYRQKGIKYLSRSVKVLLTGLSKRNKRIRRQKTEKILKEDPKLTGTEKSISEHILNYPVVALATRTDK